jgi:L-fuculose-phosphate aldolase
MYNENLLNNIKHISKSLFNTNFFGVFHGSISAKISESEFIINKKDIILDDINKNSLVKLDTIKRDYRWKLASSDVDIHEHIYEDISSAKYITFTMPPYITALSIKHSKIIPKDYYGVKLLGNQKIYNPKNFDNWLLRAPFEIPQFFKNNDKHIMVIKGFGVIAYDRDLIEMVKKIAILENSCKLLSISNL